MSIYKEYGFNEQKLEKRKQLVEAGENPYPYDFNGNEKIKSIADRALEREKKDEGLEFSTTVVGRVWSIREMGKVRFFDIKDDNGKIQIYVRKNDIEECTWENLMLLDIGDIIGVQGVVFRTRTEELTIKCEELTILSKSVVPIPIGKEKDEKVFYRATDPELKYRERYLQWILNDEDRERMKLRAKIITTIREYMVENGFLEVSTPTIEFIYGGAEARPFKTHIWAHGNKEAFLRISPELYLKRYIVAGFEKVFTICQNFRNEGIDYSHNPEFTMMEWYEAYTDYNTQMYRFEKLVSEVCTRVHGSPKIEYQGRELDFTPPWERLSVLDALKKYANIDASEMTIDQLKKEMDKHGVEYHEPISWGIAVAELFEVTCEVHLNDPVFIIDHPIEISPLTKKKRGDVRLVERFEPYILNMEVGNAYSELTDPVDQLERFMNQRAMDDSEQDFENHPIDKDFVKAIGCGMPPTGGAGLGIDRLIMILTNSPSIRDIIPFPMIKPK